MPDESSASASRTLLDLERIARRHIDDLIAIECEDADTADAITFAIRSAEQALARAHEVRRRLTSTAPTAGRVTG